MLLSSEGRAPGWLALCAACLTVAVASTVTAARRLVEGDAAMAFALPLNLLLCYLLGVGAWRRSAGSAHNAQTWR